jgi:hypothetical protein
MTERDVIFISKATPGDDEFALWLAPKLEAAGYRVFADILNLDAGERWRRTLTQTLQQRAVKMVLCCSDETLAREGVQEEIGIALDLVKQLNDPKFILPLRLRPHQKLFGVGELQYIDFEPNWAEGLAELMESFAKQNVPRSLAPNIQPQWEQYLRRKEVNVERSPEVLTSNWLRLVSVPDVLRYVQPKNPCERSVMLSLGGSFQYPVAPFLRGFLTFAAPADFAEHFLPVGPFETTQEIDFAAFMERGDEKLSIAQRDASNTVHRLVREAWEKHCERLGFLAYEYSNAVGFHVSTDKADLGSRIAWGRQGQRRSSMLRNVAKGKVWEYGVSVIPSFFPYPHLRLKSRVLFSDMESRQKTIVIPDKDKQHQLRRRVCSGWRNKAWHGRLMAFMELLAGESAVVSMAVGDRASIDAEATPIQFTAPVTTARRVSDADDDGEETDISTLGAHHDEGETE